ncbi:tryptophan synthase subunit alpha [Sulfobacillus harzensis]|uniref:Tryptophan synthase alpha chain n=1 Tax=Sulfobacillus harzensis TaxID=2729629 RepID=A0A7Y0L342_9FIRM|nr:tryptophan synthase subunit alpha [Sulfobacillus harzensis]NMP22422.1 tryptophan synthase subunit alpha [Sulfobacillus harzensis]
MSTLTQAFQAGRPALIPYVTAGYPDLGRLPGLVRALADAGADIIEIGIPFSDPLADGPVLQKAATEALERGTRVEAILEMVAKVAPAAPPLVFLTYINPVFHYGIERFATDARAAGIQGLIIPDLPWVEGREMRQAAESSGLSVIPLVAPTSTDAHLKAIRSARGFVYGVSVTGVTGMRQSVDQGVEPLVRRVKAAVKLPVAIGFGISGPEQAHRVGQVADGVIVGSALVKAIQDNPERAEETAYTFVRSLSTALQNLATKA